MVLTGILVVVYQPHYQEMGRAELIKSVSLAALTTLDVVLMHPALGEILGVAIAFTGAVVFIAA